MNLDKVLENVREVIIFKGGAMVGSNWFRKLRNFIGRPPFLMAQALVEKVPGHPLRLARFYILELEGNPEKPMRGFGMVREACPYDIAGMCRLEDKKDLFKERFVNGNRCVVAIDGDQIIGYEWFSTNQLYLEERFDYPLRIPNDSIYAFDCFIKPEYRLRGVWILFQKFKLEKSIELNKRKIITLIDYGNNPSIKAHVRFGYLFSKRVMVMGILNKNIFLVKTINSKIFNWHKAIA